MLVVMLITMLFKSLFYPSMAKLFSQVNVSHIFKPFKPELLTKMIQTEFCQKICKFLHFIFHCCDRTTIKTNSVWLKLVPAPTEKYLRSENYFYVSAPSARTARQLLTNPVGASLFREVPAVSPLVPLQREVTCIRKDRA